MRLPDAVLACLCTSLTHEDIISLSRCSKDTLGEFGTNLETIDLDVYGLPEHLLTSMESKDALVRLFGRQKRLRILQIMGRNAEVL
jgi:hypothetical protein